MNNRQHIAVLIVNAEAEEVKMIALCFRTVFPGCRVEAIYSADDVLDWVSNTIGRSSSWMNPCFNREERRSFLKSASVFPRA